MLQHSHLVAALTLTASAGLAQVPLGDLAPGGANSSPDLFSTVGRTALFRADDPRGLLRPWRTDATTSGTFAARSSCSPRSRLRSKSCIGRPTRRTAFQESTRTACTLACSQ